MAGTDGEVALRDPEAVVQEIERTREHLARTVGELTARVSPGSVARRTVSRVREQVTRPEVAVVGTAVVVTVALLSYLARRRRRP